MTNGLSHFGFDVDLREGVASEGSFVYAVTQPWVELKDERRRAHETGNVFIEVSQPDRHNPGERKPSGIYATRADRWGFRLAGDVWLLVPTERVLAAVETVVSQHGTVMGGDYNEYEGALVPLRMLVTGAGL